MARQTCAAGRPRGRARPQKLRAVLARVVRARPAAPLQLLYPRKDETMKLFGLLPKCLGKIFNGVSHFACNSPTCRYTIAATPFLAASFASRTSSFVFVAGSPKWRRGVAAAIL